MQPTISNDTVVNKNGSEIHGKVEIKKRPKNDKNQIKSIRRRTHARTLPCIQSTADFTHILPCRLGRIVECSIVCVGA